MTPERRVIIADDEPLARERLQSLLARHVGYRVVDECGDGDEALAVIERDRPDLAFLDIRMPGRSGVEVAQELLEREVPTAVVFVTAHDDFALRAFGVSAADYLVKPVDRERFDQTLTRLERRYGERAPELVHAEVRAVLDQLRPERRRERFVVRSPRGHYFVRTDDIETAVADGNYVALTAGGRRHLTRETMKAFETSVDSARFIRIHRSIIVNVDRIARIEPLGHGEYRLTMHGGARFESSRAYSDQLRRLLR